MKVSFLGRWVFLSLRKQPTSGLGKQWYHRQMLAVFLFNRLNATHNRKRTSIEFIQRSYKQVLFTCKRKKWENVVNALLRILKERRSWVTCGVVGSGNEIECEQSYLAREQQTHSRSSLLSLARRLHFWRHRFNNRKILPNMVISSWFWWITRVLVANENRGNILNE